MDNRSRSKQDVLQVPDTTVLRKYGGFSSAVDLSLVKITGSDANRYLQAQTTNDVNILATGYGQPSSFVDRKARPVATFQLYRTADAFAIICDTTELKPLLQHLDKFLFADKVEIETVSDSRFLTIQGPRSRSLLKACLDELPTTDFFDKDAGSGSIESKPVSTFRLSLTGEEGFLLLVPEHHVPSVEKKLRENAGKLGMVELDRETLEIARIEAGLVKMNVDFDGESLLAETTLDLSHVSYNKGCFQGQEVLARIRTYGAPTRALVGLTITAEDGSQLDEIRFPLDTELKLESEEIGWIKSNCYSRFLHRFIAIGLVKRDYRTPDKQWAVTAAGKNVIVTVTLLPFYHANSPSDTARELYEEALQIFASEDESVDADLSESVRLLRESLTLDPLFEDSYETLGVILSKRNRLDEAIELMEHLTRLNADSVMAHTNLSVFYVEKGWKEKAEDEKAISMSIRMRQAAMQVSKAKEDEEKKKVSEEETRERMGMFKQVLEIDADDQLANYGIGDCLVELSQFEEAIPHLQKSLELKPTHTVGYLVLGKAYEGLKRADDARSTYEKGIDVAAKRGDMEPLKKMQERLAGIAGSA